MNRAPTFARSFVRFSIVRRNPCRVGSVWRCTVALDIGRVWASGRDWCEQVRLHVRRRHRVVLAELGQLILNRASGIERSRWHREIEREIAQTGGRSAKRQGVVVAVRLR